MKLSSTPHTDTYTERLFYADSAVPRYTGCPTGRVNILGGRYDYRYDAHDRLTHATYTAATGGSDEDFTVRYIYDNMARPQTLLRQGITGVDADGAETFGPLDILTYTYDDAGRGVALTTYDHRDLPLQYNFQTGLRQTNIYDAAGSLVRYTFPY